MPPVELLLDALLYLFLPAALTAAVLLPLLQWLGGPKLAPAAAALGLAAGVFLGMAAREGVQRWSAGEFWSSWWRSAWNLTSADTTWNWLPWATLAFLAIGCVTSSSELPRVVAWIYRAAGVPVIFWLIPQATRTEYWWLAPSYAALVLCQWAILEYVAKHPPDGTALFCLALSAWVAGGVLLFAASGRSSEAAIILGSALGGMTVIAWWRRTNAGAAVPGAVVFLCGLLLAGQQGQPSDDVSWYVFALPAVAPLALGLAWPVRDWPELRLRLLRVGLVLLPLVAAIILARLQAGPLEFE